MDEGPDAREDQGVTEAGQDAVGKLDPGESPPLSRVEEAWALYRQLAKAKQEEIAAYLSTMIA